jgi:hypothetical protein
MITAAAVAMIGVYLSSHTSAYVAAAVASVVVVLSSPARRRRRQLARHVLAPVTAAVSPTLGPARVRLVVNKTMSSLIPAPSRPASPLELAVRRWYGSWVEPLLRWLPDRGQRAVWWLRRTKLIGAVSRPSDQQPRITLEVQQPYVSADDRRYVSSVVHAKVPITGLVEAWDQVGPRVTASWTVRARPPRRVDAGDLVVALGRLPEHEFFLGLGAGGTPVVVSLHADSPHIAISAGSGAGKSVLAQLVAVQVLARGGEVIILDRKSSHRWARDHDRVTYATKPAAMHAALVWAGELADQRNSQALHQDDGWDPGHRVLVLCEELNGTIGQLRAFWDDTRGAGDPKTSPALRALGELLYMGRSAKVNVVGVAQMLTARAIGGPESRENFGIRCLARYTANSWRMLTGIPMPPPSRALGRWQVVVGGQATECQVAYLTPAEARSLSRAPGVQSAGGNEHVVPGSGAAPDRPPTCNVTGDTGPTRDMPPAVLSLADAIAEGLLPWSKEATKKRLLRDPNRPQPVGKRGRQTLLYDRQDLVSWAAG